MTLILGLNYNSNNSNNNNNNNYNYTNTNVLTFRKETVNTTFQPEVFPIKPLKR